jgi:hypothetical protein
MANGIWNKSGCPKDGETMSLDLTFKRQEVKYKDAQGVEHTSIYLVNIGEGSGKFRHGVAIATLPNGDRVTLEVKVKLMPVKAQASTTISNSSFKIN